MKNISIFYRGIDFEKNEKQHADSYFSTSNLMANLPEKSFVIPRYSIYPFYSYFLKEIKALGHTTINDYNHVLYISDLQNYVYDLRDFTPKTYIDCVNLPEGKYVLKGETNSKKNSWKQDMFAENKSQAIDIYGRLSNDSLIGQQKIYIREYVPLKKFMTGVNGMPVTNEFRIFVAFDEIVAFDYYWSNYLEDLKDIGVVPDKSKVPMNFVKEIIKKVNKQSNFYVIDIGQTENGDWIVVELNDGQCSGLSAIDPNYFYSRLFNIVKSELIKK